MLTVRAATSPTVNREVSDCTIINIFARRVKGNISVGLDALAFVKDVHRDSKKIGFQWSGAYPGSDI